MIPLSSDYVISFRYHVPTNAISLEDTQMPEDEFETLEFKEKLEEATERAVEAAEKRESWVVSLSFSTAIIAVFAAIASMQSGAFSNEALIQKNEAMLAQAK